MNEIPICSLDGPRTGFFSLLHSWTLRLNSLCKPTAANHKNKTLRGWNKNSPRELAMVVHTGIPELRKAETGRSQAEPGSGNLVTEEDTVSKLN